MVWSSFVKANPIHYWYLSTLSLTLGANFYTKNKVNSCVRRSFLIERGIAMIKKSLQILAIGCCLLSLTACKKEEPVETIYTPPVQGGYYIQTEPSEEPTTESTVAETEPTIEETEPIVETVPEPTFIELTKETHEGNEMYLKYNLLSDVQKELYLLACEAINNGSSELFLSNDMLIDVDSARGAIKSIWFDHPEYFWYTGKYTLNYSEDQVVSIKFDYYTQLINKLESNKNSFNKVVDALIARANEKNSILDAEKMIHDYICKSTTYEENDLDQSAWSCLIDRKTVCAGYSRAFQVVMMKMGIPCYTVAGDYDNGESVARHAWNVVKIVDGFYAVDLTANDCDEKSCVIYNKYNFAYDTYPGAYIPDEDSTVFPTCTETRYSFKNTYGINENVASAMSFTDSETVIYSLEEFRIFHEEVCRNNSFGEWEVKYVVVGEELMNQITEYIQAGTYIDTYIRDIAVYNNVEAYRLQENTVKTIFGDTYGVVHTVILSDDSAPAESSEQ